MLKMRIKLESPHNSNKNFVSKPNIHFMNYNIINL